MWMQQVNFTSDRQRPVKLLWVALLLLTLSAAPPPASEPRISTVQDTAYVALRDFADFYQLPRPVPEENHVTIRHRDLRIELELNSRKARINGITVWLHQPVILHRRHWRIAAVDVRTIFDPLLRPFTALLHTGYRVIVLDPGHGGRDPGGIGPMGTQEKEIVLRIAQSVARHLRRSGNEVYLTRDDDHALTLAERIEFARAKNADLFVSIHLNTAGNTEARGSETFALAAGGFPGTGDRGDGPFAAAQPANQFDGANQMLAYQIQRHLLHATGNEDRGVRRSRFFVLREANCPTVLVECAFLTHPTEERNLQRLDYRERIARGIARGIDDYLGIVIRAQLEEIL
jgi:N-acetylmuramoyl-L-alanine amidase